MSDRSGRNAKYYKKLDKAFSYTLATLDREANVYKWGEDIRKLMKTGMKSLFFGDGELPKGLVGVPLRVVRERFAKTADFQKLHALPGMKADWYSTAVVTARDRYKTSRQPRR